MSVSSVSEPEDIPSHSQDAKGARPALLLHQNRRSNVKKQWRAAAMMTRKLRDPWGNIGFDELEEERVTRHMYNPRKCKWKTDEIVVKIESKSFAHGAMRECFRMKKLSKFSQNPNWQNASNYVAKRYMKEVDRNTYFDDVKLQMDAKLWGEEYSKLDIPKKVDFCQTYIIEFKGREGSPLYGVEHFIDGGYIKYNSNSGFVSDVNRLTPQTFSHFTFEKSNHQLIVVDIQGVGDLYTDPQMHTVDMKDYGEANLGTRGMALFFSSHVCSPLCEMLGLTQFDLSEKELVGLRSRRWNFSTSTTVSLEDSYDGSSSPRTRHPVNPTVGEVYRHLNLKDMVLSKADREASVSSLDELDSPFSDSPFFSDSPRVLESPLVNPMNNLLARSSNAGGVKITVSPSEGNDAEDVKEGGGKKVEGKDASPVSSIGVSASILKVKTELREAGENAPRRMSMVNSLQILGLIHLDLANYHQMGRFSQDQAPNPDSAMFHLTKSANCGNTDALYTLAHIYLQQSHAKLEELSVEASAVHECEGMEYLVQAAEGGMKVAMLEVAKALDTGIGLGKAPQDDPDFTGVQRSRNWLEAVKWYNKSISAAENEEDNGSTHSDPLADEPVYAVLSRMAAMYQEGGYSLEKDPQKAGELYTEAAEAAMNAMKGKLSTKYYMLAEEAWAEVDE